MTDWSVRRRLGALAGVVIAFHVVGWGMLAWSRSSLGATLLGPGVLAYVLGLRHAFDADHIAAIDNTTRKFRQDGRKMVGTGFFFALGHATIVGVVAFALAVAASRVASVIPAVHHTGGLVAMGVSGGFLALIGIANLLALIGLLRTIFGRTGDTTDAHSIEEHRGARGFVSRFVSGWLDSIHSSWQLYPVGLLFGLGFDTVSEMALLSSATTAAGSGTPIWAVMVLPLLFAAGMTLMDSLDGVFMLYAYDWAFSTASRKAYYNVTVTSLSVFVALGVGTVELLHVFASMLDLTGRFWDVIRTISLGSLGYVVVVLFGLTWLGSYLVWRLLRWSENPRLSMAESATRE